MVRARYRGHSGPRIRTKFMQTAWEFTTIFMKPNGRPWTQLEQLYDSNTPEYPVGKLEQENIYIYKIYIYNKEMG